MDETFEANIPMAEPAEPMTPAEVVPIETGKRTRKPRTPKETCRDMKEIMGANIKTLNTPELQVMVKALQEQNVFLNNKCRELDITAQKAFAQFKELDEAYQKMVMEANAKLRYAEDAVRICYQSIKMIGGKL